MVSQKRRHHILVHIFIKHWQILKISSSLSHSGGNLHLQRPLKISLHSIMSLNYIVKYQNISIRWRMNLLLVFSDQYTNHLTRRLFSLQCVHLVCNYRSCGQFILFHNVACFKCSVSFIHWSFITRFLLHFSRRIITICQYLVKYGQANSVLYQICLWITL